MGSAALSFQTVPPAPGREPGGTAQPAAPPAQGAPPAADPFGGFPIVLLMLVPLLIIMLWGNRSQTKKQQAMIASLAKGDRLVMQGGMVGKLVELDERFVKVEISPGVKVDFLKSSIIGKDTPETQAAAEKAVADKK